MQPTAIIIARAALRVVRALGQALDDVRAGGDLAAAPDLDPVTQTAADERVVQQHQTLGQRSADVILVLGGRRAGAALGPVDDDEVRRDALGDHRLADARSS